MLVPIEKKNARENSHAFRLPRKKPLESNQPTSILLADMMSNDYDLVVGEIRGK